MSNAQPSAPAATPPKERTIFVLYIPGGAMLGIIPSLVLNQIEKLTECHATDLFQVFDGVSTGSILVAGLNLRDPADTAKPEFTAHNSFEMFCKHGPRYFPHIPGRMTKMWTANALNIFIDYVDPQAADELAIYEIRDLCQILKDKAPWEYRDRIQHLEKLATSQWMTKKTQHEVLKICDELDDLSDDINKITAKLSEVAFLRTSSSRLGILFKKATINSAKFVLRNYAHDYLFDPKTPRDNYQEFMRDTRLSETLRSVYISAYDIQSGQVKTFFSRKQDFFSTASDNPSITSANDNKLWDIVMASTANPFAFPPHVTEDGRICSDKAPVHTPLHCIQDVLDHKPADARVKLVVLGTGNYITKNNKMDGETLRERYIKYGVAGNLVKGREIAELEHYVMSSMRETIRQRIGDDNIIEISPRLSPHTHTEMMRFPAKDVLNASKENIEKIVQRGQDLIVEEDEAIRNLSQSLIDNLHNLGQIDDEKHRRVTLRLGVRTPPAEIIEQRQEQNEIVDRNVPPPPGPLRRAFNSVTAFFRPRKPPTGPLPPGL